MSVVQDHWARRQVRTEQGIYYGNDEVSELCGDPSHGYRVDNRAPLAFFVRDDPAGWIPTIELCSARTGEWQVTGGATTLEGGGFVAVESAVTGKLEWVIHVRESEEFTQVWTDGELIRAASGDDSDEHRWSIPIAEPELFVVRSTT